MKTAILGLIYGIEIVKYILALRLVFQERYRGKYIPWIMGVVYLLFLEINGAEAAQEQSVVYIMAILVLGIGLQGSIWNRIFKVAVVFILISSIDEAISIPLGYWMKQVPEDNTILFESRFLESLWGFLVILLLYGIGWIAKKRNLRSLKGNLMTLLIAGNGIAIAFTLAGLSVAKDYAVNNTFRILTDVMVSVAYVCLCLLCWLLVYMGQVNEQMRRMVIVEQELKNAQRAYYHSLLEKEEQTRKFRHDLNNHLICLRYLADENEMEEVKKYLNRMSGQLDEIQKICYATGNEVLDVILSDKLSHLKVTARAEVTGKFTRELKMDEMDLCTIFSNLIQNAVDELERIEEGERWIAIQIRSGDQFVRFQIQNGAQGCKKLTKNGLPGSEKQNKRNHGIGLSNVREVVEKYEGQLEIESIRNMFSVGVILPIK